MWCKNCNIETNEKICPLCGESTVEDYPVEVCWCRNCMIPLINISIQSDKGICPICGGKTRYLSKDLRPVFPEERLLIELILGKKPNCWEDRAIWACDNRYYVDGAPLSIKPLEERQKECVAKRDNFSTGDTIVTITNL